jgi:hypothetical protein
MAPRFRQTFRFLKNIPFSGRIASPAAVNNSDLHKRGSKSLIFFQNLKSRVGTRRVFRI